jgi:hypothetical protein
LALNYLNEILKKELKNERIEELKNFKTFLLSLFLGKHSTTGIGFGPIDVFHILLFSLKNLKLKITKNIKRETERREKGSKEGQRRQAKGKAIK